MRHGIIPLQESRALPFIMKFGDGQNAGAQKPRLRPQFCRFDKRFAGNSPFRVPLARFRQSVDVTSMAQFLEERGRKKVPGICQPASHHIERYIQRIHESGNPNPQRAAHQIEDRKGIRITRCGEVRNFERGKFRIFF